jgi:DNA repair ATPase RecN
MMLVVLICGGSIAANAQAQALEQLSLDITKLAQFKQILSDMKTGYQILTDGYNAVKDISEGNFNLHKVFLDALLAVSPAVKNYIKVVNIINNQLTLVSEYKTAYSRITSSGQFNPDEITYVMSVYNSLITASVSNLEHLITILTAGSLRMNDAERLRAIDQLDEGMTGKLTFLRHFNNNAVMLGLQRAREQNDLQGVGNMYQLTP